MDRDFLEAHFEMTALIMEHLNLHYLEDNFSLVLLTHSQQGRGGLWGLAERWTKEFQETFGDVVWGEDLDWIDTLEKFFEEKNKI